MINYHNARFLLSAALPNQIPSYSLPEFAFAGRSNVGKSSLINKFLNRKSIARVSATPGKTITINYYDIDSAYYLVDLPGYGYAKAARSEKDRWNRLIEHYFQSNRDIKMVFSLIDMRHPPTADDQMMLDFLIQSDLPFTVVLTKSDKLKKKSQREARLAGFETELALPDGVKVIPFSAETGEGVEPLRDLIESLLEQE